VTQLSNSYLLICLLIYSIIFRKSGNSLEFSADIPWKGQSVKFWSSIEFVIHKNCDVFVIVKSICYWIRDNPFIKMLLFSISCLFPHFMWHVCHNIFLFRRKRIGIYFDTFVWKHCIFWIYWLPNKELPYFCNVCYEEMIYRNYFDWWNLSFL
jgi:hypothetical protein